MAYKGCQLFRGEKIMNKENDFYYASGKKIRLIRSEDTFAIRYNLTFRVV